MPIPISTKEAGEFQKMLKDRLSTCREDVTNASDSFYENWSEPKQKRFVKFVMEALGNLPENCTDPQKTSLTDPQKTNLLNLFAITPHYSINFGLLSSLLDNLHFRNMTRISKDTLSDFTFIIPKDSGKPHFTDVELHSFLYACSKLEKVKLGGLSAVTYICDYNVDAFKKSSEEERKRRLQVLATERKKNPFLPNIETLTLKNMPNLEITYLFPTFLLKEIEINIDNCQKCKLYFIDTENNGKELLVNSSTDCKIKKNLLQVYFEHAARLSTEGLNHEALEICDYLIEKRGVKGAPLYNFRGEIKLKLSDNHSASADFDMAHTLNGPIHNETYQQNRTRAGTAALQKCSKSAALNQLRISYSKMAVHGYNAVDILLGILIGLTALTLLTVSIAALVVSHGASSVLSAGGIMAAKHMLAYSGMILMGAALLLLASFAAKPSPILLCPKEDTSKSIFSALFTPAKKEEPADQSQPAVSSDHLLQS